MAGIKVGEGYIEISPKVTGINRELRRNIQSTLNAWENVKFSAAPKITGITKKWQAEIQKELNSVVSGLEVKVKVKLDKDTLTASFSDVTVEAEKSGTDASTGMSKGFAAATDNIKRMMREVELAIKAGLTPERSWDVEKNLAIVSRAYGDMVEDIDTYTNREVAAIRSGMIELETLQNRVTQTIQKESNAVKKANEDLEKETRKTIAETDKMVSSTSSAISQHSSNLSRALKSFDDLFKPSAESIRTEFDKITPHIDRMTNGSLVSMDKFRRGIIGVEKAVKLGFAEATKKGFDDVAKGLSAFATENGISLASQGAKVGQSFGGALSEAISTTVRFGLARMVVGLPLMLAGIGYAMGPIASAISSLASGFTLLAGQAVYAVGALAALPAVFGAIAQAGGVLGLAFFGVQDALSALQTEQDKSSIASTTMADAIEAASRRVENAKRSLADAVGDSARRITDAEENVRRVAESVAERISDAQNRLAEVTEAASERVSDAQARLADAQAEAAQRIEDAQARLADIIESSSERISDAETRLSEAREDSARRIEDAQRRLSDAIEDGARRVTDAEDDYGRTIRGVTEAQDALNEARETARERLENLALAISGGILDEKAAQLAIEKAKEKLDAFRNDPDRTDREKREAEQAYQEAIQKLKEIQEKNGDLREEQAAADKEGVEGSKEVTDAKDDLQKAIERQIAAEKKLEDARKDATRGIADAERALQDARLDGAKAVADAEKALADSRKDASKQIADAEKAINDARLDGAKAVADAEKAIGKAREDGVKQVANAEKDLADARKNGARDVLDSEKALADARKNGARQIEDAQRALREAMEDVAKASEKQSKEATAAEVALRKLSPAAREFVMFLNDELIPKLREIQWSIQEAFFPPLKKALEQSYGLFDIFKEKLTDTATIFGNFTLKFSDWLNTDESKNRIGEILDSNNRIFEKLGDAAIKASDGVLILVNGSGPFLERMAGLVDKIAGKFRDVMVEAEKSGKLQELFKRVGDTIETLMGIAGSLGRILFGALDIAYKPGKDLLDLIAKNLETFAKWVESAEGKQTLKEWFEKGKDVMIELGALIKGIVLEFKKLGDNVDFAAIVKVIRTDFLPALSKIAEAFSGDGGEGLIKLIEGFSLALQGLALVIDGVSWIASLLSNSIEYAARMFAAGIKIMKGDIAGGLADVQAAGDKYSSWSNETFGSKLPAHLRSATDAYGNLKKESTVHIEGFSADQTRAWGTIGGTAKNAAGDLSKDVTSKFNGLTKDSSKAFEDLKGNTGSSWGNIRDQAKGRAEETRKGVVDKFDELTRGAQTKWGDMTSWLARQGPTVTGAVASGTVGMPGAGRDTIQGFWNGVIGKWNEFIGWWNENLGNIQEIARRVLGINSPSRVMAAIGQGIGEGLANGITSSVGLVTNATSAMASSVSKTWGKMILPIDARLPNVQRNATPTRMPSNDLFSPSQPSGGSKTEKNYNLTLVAAPTIPTERQMMTMLTYADTLFK